LNCRAKKKKTCENARLSARREARCLARRKGTVRPVTSVRTIRADRSLVIAGNLSPFCAPATRVKDGDRPQRRRREAAEMRGARPGGAARGWGGARWRAEARRHQAATKQKDEEKMAANGPGCELHGNFTSSQCSTFPRARDHGPLPRVVRIGRLVGKCTPPGAAGAPPPISVSSHYAVLPVVCTASGTGNAKETNKL
jgi:hypothetical protein